MTPGYRVLGLLNTIVVLEDKNHQVLPLFWCHLVIPEEILSCV